MNSLKLSNNKNAYNKYVVKHKSAKLFMTYAVGKLEAALKISHLTLTLLVRGGADSAPPYEISL